ncbi:MAG: sodium:proton antiporter [Thermoanaerobaculia bacterium]
MPFEWTLHLWPQWLAVVGALLVIFNVVDQRELAVDEKADPDSLLEEMIEHKPLRIDGWQNIFFLVGVVGVILAARGGTRRRRSRGRSGSRRG